MAEDLDLADRIYAGIALGRHAEPRRGLLGVGDIVRFVHGGSGSLTADQTRQLFANSHLVRSYRELMSRLAVAEVPAVAAASSGDLLRRHFDGGVLTLSEDDAEQVSLLVVLDEDRRGHPVDLIVMSAAGAEKLAFQFAPDADGELFEFVDQSTPEGRRLVEALRDPFAEGFFVRKTQPDA